MLLGCSSGFVDGPAAVVVRRRDGIVPRGHIRSLAGRRESRAPGLRADVGRWLCSHRLGRSWGEGVWCVGISRSRSMIGFLGAWRGRGHVGRV